MTEEEPADRFARYVRKWLILLTAAWVLCAVGFGLQLEANGDRAAEAERLAKYNRSLAREIQSERKRNVYLSCRDVNNRHDNALRAYDTLIARLPPDRRDRAREGRASIVILIEALVPYRDCEAYAEQQVDTGPSIP